MPRKTNFTIIAILFSSALAFGQSMDTTSRKAHIHIERDGNKTSFKAETPPLIQISGAPEAFYTYFWEFGDGHFSREENPEHIYPQKGSYEVRLEVTNNYDNGKPPPSRPQTVEVDEIKHNQPSASIGDDIDGFSLLKNREPVPQEEIVVVMQYENEQSVATNGKLYLFYNERRFKANNFDLVDVRTHYGEKQIDNALLTGLFNLDHSQYQWASIGGIRYTQPFLQNGDSSRRQHIHITIDEAEQEFRDNLVFDFNDLAPGEKRNMFLSFKTTPEMIQDTSAIIKIRGVFVPDERSGSHQVKDVEMEITTSHDPNKMAVNDTRINYRFRKNKKLKYKIRFQNNGEGPASTIKLEVDVPPIIDKSTLEVLDMHPKCAICPDEQKVSYSCLDTLFSEDKITFVFNNIYLPGSNQKGVNKYDSTKGFVKYSVKFKDKAPKVNSASRTAIIFDKNDPILTNYAKTRFKPGLSLGAIGGFASIPGLDNSKNYFIGVTASPFMPQHGYLQAELQAHIGSYSRESLTEVRTPFGNGIELTELEVINEQEEFDYLELTLVPVSYRYNINRFIGFAGGVQVSTKLTDKVDREVERQYFIEFPNGVEPNPDRGSFETTENTDHFSGFNPGAFVCLNLGLTRLGPSAGVRYIYQIDEPHTQWTFYLSWKF